MPAEYPGAIPDAFGLADKRYVHLIGGGGKTTLMFALAHALAAGGRTVLTTTSTRIRYPTPAESDHVMVGTDAASLTDRLRAGFETLRHITAAASYSQDEEKLRGLDVGQLDRLAEARVAGCLLVEADGAAGRSLKAHLAHEPVVSGHADLVIVVIGVDCVGAPMDELHVHRAGLLRERLGRPRGSVVTVDDVAGIVFHRDGYLARVGDDCEAFILINKAGTPEAVGEARRLARRLRSGTAGTASPAS